MKRIRYSIEAASYSRKEILGPQNRACHDTGKNRDIDLPCGNREQYR